MTAESFAPWPEPPLVHNLRTALDHLVASVDNVIAYADRHDGRAPVGPLRAALVEVAELRGAEA